MFMILNSAAGVSSLGSAIDYLCFIVSLNKSLNFSKFSSSILSKEVG